MRLCLRKKGLSLLWLQQLSRMLQVVSLNCEVMRNHGKNLKLFYCFFIPLFPTEIRIFALSLVFTGSHTIKQRGFHLDKLSSAALNCTSVGNCGYLWIKYQDQTTIKWD